MQSCGVPCADNENLDSESRVWWHRSWGSSQAWAVNSPTEFLEFGFSLEIPFLLLLRVRSQSVFELVSNWCVKLMCPCPWVSVSTQGARGSDRGLSLPTRMATYITDASAYVGTLTFDIDSVTARAGFAGDGEPRAVFPATVCTGVPDSESWAVLEAQDDAHLPKELLSSIDARPLARVDGGVDEWVLR